MEHLLQKIEQDIKKYNLDKDELNKLWDDVLFQYNNLKMDIEVDTEIDIEVDTEIDIEVDTEIDIEVDTEVDTEIDIEVDTEVDTEVERS